MAGGGIQQRPNHVNTGILTGAFMTGVGVIGLILLISGTVFSICSAALGMAAAYLMLFLMAGLATIGIAWFLARRKSLRRPLS